MTKILALDASTTAIGWAVLESDRQSPDDLLYHGLHKPKGELWERITKGTRWFHGWMEQCTFPGLVIAIERPFVRMGRKGGRRIGNWNSTIKQSYMVGALGAIAGGHGFRIIEINPQERLTAAGISSKAPSLKRAVVARVNQMYGLGLKVTEHDIADAVLVGWAAQGKLKGDQL